MANRQIHFLLPEHDAIVAELMELNSSIRHGKLVGESPALADTLVMHTEFWSRKGRRRLNARLRELADEVAPEIDDYSEETQPKPVRYGLSCKTGLGAGA